MIRKKSQVWSIDLIAGITIFVGAIIVYFVFTNNIHNYQENEIDEVYNELIIASDTLLTEGNPPDWTSSDVEEIGITNGDFRINETKLLELEKIGYSRSKLLLKTRYDYLIFFENSTQEIKSFNGTSYFGKPGIDKDNLKSIDNPETLINIRRFAVYDSKIISMVVYLWE